MTKNLTKHIDRLESEAALYSQFAKDHAARALHRSADGRSINELDARRIRDHEIRAESFKTAARLLNTP